MSPITTTTPTSKRADMLKQPYTTLQTKLQRGRQLIERNSIKDRTMAIFWAEMENVIMQILDIIADMFDSCTPLDDITPISPSASLDVIAILSISNKFSQLTRSFVQLVSDNDTAIQWRQCNYRRWAGSKRTQEQQQQRHMIQSIVDLVRKESNIMLEQLQLLRDFVSQHGRMYSQHGEKHRTTAESIQHLLISHANNLVDTLVAFFKSPAFITLVNKLELAINQQQQQRFLDNNSSTMLVLVQDAVVGYDMTRDTEAHQNHDDQQEDTGK
ncbi:hypothetical protein K492DRAFT_199634 [Lichtheimia hyalospora FSU 10163]|nr:hypothetical protein K492DRAFT_199634 [Lichtheimia hyalospora FSU 10163]